VSSGISTAATDPLGPEVSSAPKISFRPTSSFARGREHTSSLLVTALSAAFGAGLIQATGFVNDLYRDEESSSTTQLALVAVAMVFILLALYVASIVTANTFGTIIAGRARTVALLRLVGASARTLRRDVAREGLVVGLVGALAGALGGVALSHGALAWGVATGVMPEAAYRWVDPLVLLPVVLVVLTTWIASHVGSKAVLSVTPVQATGAAQERSHEDSVRRPVRTVVAILLIVGGGALLALGVLLGLVSPFGIVVAFFGGVASFTGVVVGAHWILPGVLRLVGRALGRSAPATLAAANAVRYPERSTRSTVGLVIGVTLVTTFAVAMATYQTVLLDVFGGEDVEGVLAVTVGVLSALIGFSGVIAAVGMVNNLSLSVLQRTRELGLLRALGFTARQVRGMILAESAQMSVASVGLGLALGVLYGWAAAQSLLGSLSGTGLVWPTMPWVLLAVLVFGAALLAGLAAVTPSRRATAVSPVAALAVD
jgi:putative ABC transport system permease protein